MCTYKKMQTMLNSTQKLPEVHAYIVLPLNDYEWWLDSSDWLVFTMFVCLTVWCSSVTFDRKIWIFFKSLLHRNGTKLGDFYGIWNVNTHKNWGLDSSRLSGRKKNSHTCALRSKMTDHRKLMGNRHKLFCLQSTNRPQYWKKSTQQ